MLNPTENCERSLSLWVGLGLSEEMHGAIDCNDLQLEAGGDIFYSADVQYPVQSYCNKIKWTACIRRKLVKSRPPAALTADGNY